MRPTRSSLKHLLPVLSAALAAAVYAPLAEADTEVVPAAAKPVSGSRKALATGATFVPGLIVHGSGHFVAGHRTTAFKLLGLEALGVGLAVGGLSVAAATGASRRFIEPVITVTMAGAGLLFMTFLADLYGVLAPEGGFGAAPLEMPWVETELGYRYVYNPTFSYGSFLVTSLDLRWRSLRLTPSGWFALDDQNARLRALAAHRFFGPKTPGSARPKDGSFIDVEGAITHHRYTSDGFSITSGEIALHGRLDMEHIGPTLKGSFAELTIGGAVNSDAYHGITTEGNSFLLGRFGYGIYIGRPAYPRGEVLVYYDHRHDDFAAGWKIPGVGGGVGGHVGAEGSLYFNDRWGALVDAQIGSALLAGASVLYRYGGEP
jgi:hypothetical protein